MLQMAPGCRPYVYTLENTVVLNVQHIPSYMFIIKLDPEDDTKWCAYYCGMDFVIKACSGKNPMTRHRCLGIARNKSCGHKNKALTLLELLENLRKFWSLKTTFLLKFMCPTFFTSYFLRNSESIFLNWL